MRRLFSFVAIAAVVVGLASTPAGAQTLDPGEFQVDVPLPGGGGAGLMPTCTPELQSIAIAGGTATCTLNKTVTGDTASGTVSNATLAGQYGTAFTSGTMRRTCDMALQLSMDVTLPAGAVASGTAPTITGAGTVDLACTWAMSFSDAAASSMDGTMELHGRIASGDITTTGLSGADIQLDMRVYVTGGTGTFAGYTGSGTLEQRRAMSLLGGNGAGAPASTGGSTPSTALPDPICAGVGLPSGCTGAQALAACQANPTLAGCAAIITSIRAHRIAVRSSNGPMRLRLVRSGGAVRILSPAPAAGAKAATVRATTPVRIVATSGASCTVATSVGTIVGTATAKGAAKVTVVKAKAGSYAKAKWIQATCTLRGKRFSSGKVRITL